LDSYNSYLLRHKVSKIHMHLQFIATCPKHKMPFFGY
jgi:hypothetical protein